MKVCKRCLEAIECKEGYQPTLKLCIDEDDDTQDSKCDWCEEDGFDILYELI
ncbi:MAG: hypothetical protein IKU15_00135 [Clostridia bacterium]|nr:hypothetical protein [Clostridia bacterium]